MESAGEGGSWGIALLASYMRHGKDLPLEDFLSQKVFSASAGQKTDPVPEDIQGFRKFIKRYTTGLKIERAAIESMKA
jgi:hypothetical protein